MEVKILNEAELLSIKRLKIKGVKLQDIADRIGIPVERVKQILKNQNLKLIPNIYK